MDVDRNRVNSATLDDHVRQVRRLGVSKLKVALLILLVACTTLTIKNLVQDERGLKRAVSETVQASDTLSALERTAPQGNPGVQTALSQARKVADEDERVHSWEDAYTWDLLLAASTILLWCAWACFCFTS